MITNLELARLLYQLIRRKGGCWGGKYDRLEHFKRFNIKEAVKELSGRCWVLVHNKPKYTGISLNPQYKKEIIEFIVKYMPYLKGMIK